MRKQFIEMDKIAQTILKKHKRDNRDLDVVILARDLGFKVSESLFKNPKDKILIRREGNEKEIIVSKNIEYISSRFLIIYMLSKYILHHLDGNEDFLYIYNPTKESVKGTDELALAGCFLINKKVFRKSFKTITNTSYGKEYEVRMLSILYDIPKGLVDIIIRYYLNISY